MTLKTSLFDKGIFKNTIKRFKWGGLLYFVILFFCVPFVILVNGKNMLERYTNDYYIRNIAGKIILRSDFTIFPLLLAIAVPTVVAALSFRFVHSQKQGIAVHALPVTRLQNYFSTVLASFTLMGVPVILNGLILLIMSFFGYGKLVSASTVIFWTFVFLSIIFIMFSISAFSAVLTGNTAAHIVINAFIHAILPIIALTINLVCTIFLYGFVINDNFVAEKILAYTPLINIFIKGAEGLGDYTFFKTPEIWIYLGGAIIFYILAFLLYKNRKIESCGEIAAFEIFKPILKYSIATAAAIVTFAITYALELSLVPSIIVIAVITAIFYFALEMLFNKSFKIFHKYKGYLALSAALCLVTLFFAYTSIFGYETYIPKKEDIESAAILNGYWREALVEDGSLVNDVISSHNALISDIRITNRDLNEEESYIFLKYKLKNGKTVERRYPVSEKSANKLMTKMYEYDEYKFKIYGFDNINIENVVYTNVTLRRGNYGHSQKLFEEDAVSLIKAVKKDVSMLSYEEIELSGKISYIDIEFSHNVIDNEKSKVFKNIEYDTNNEYTNPEHITEHFQININSNYKNTMEFLEEKGYLKEMTEGLENNLWLYKIPASQNGEEFKLKEDVGVMSEFQISKNDCVKLSADDSKKVCNEYFNEPRYAEKGNQNGEFYTLYYFNDYDTTLHYTSFCFQFEKDKLPEYLKKYLD